MKLKTGSFLRSGAAMELMKNVLVTLTVLLFCVFEARANNQVVSDCADNGGPNQLRAKLVAAESSGGGTISFTCGPATVVLQNGVLPSITANTTINGNVNGGVITLSGNNTSGGSNGTRIFNVNANATLTLNNMVLRDGYSNDDGGAVRNDGTLKVNSCKFLYNATSASWSGSAILSLGPLTITKSEFAFNTGGGGAVKPRSANAVTHISGSSFHDNTSTASAGGGYGGAMQLHDAPHVTVDDCDFSTNQAGTAGGAIHVGTGSALTLTNSTITGNRAVSSSGGGLEVLGSAFISNTDVTSNKTLAAGAGINGGSGAKLEIVGSTVSQNITQGYADNVYADKAYGGGIRSLGTLTISDSTISNNTANVGMKGAVGGGIYHETGVMTLTNG